MIILRKPFDVSFATFVHCFSAVAAQSLLLFAFVTAISKLRWIMQKTMQISSFSFRITHLIDTTQIKRNSNGIIIIRVLEACSFRMRCEIKPALAQATHQSVQACSHFTDDLVSIFLDETYANSHFLIDLNWAWLQVHSSVNKLCNNLINIVCDRMGWIKGLRQGDDAALSICIFSIR